MWGAEHGASVLQWSHALTRVETEARREEGIPRDDASMEPRTHARGNRSRQGCAHSVAHRFNGATHSRAWKHQLPSRGKATKLASMEPRTHARGNDLAEVGILIDVIASMEPRTHARGKVALGKELERRIEDASMEPRTHARGNLEPDVGKIL